MEHYISQLEAINGPTRRRQDKDYRFGEIPLEELKGTLQTLSFVCNIVWSHLPNAGSRRGYYKIRKHYHVILGSQYEDMICGMVRNELPSLALGMHIRSSQSIQCAKLKSYWLFFVFLQASQPRPIASRSSATPCPSSPPSSPATAWPTSTTPTTPSSSRTRGTRQSSDTEATSSWFERQKSKQKTFRVSNSFF